MTTAGLIIGGPDWQRRNFFGSRYPSWPLPSTCDYAVSAGNFLERAEQEAAVRGCQHAFLDLDGLPIARFLSKARVSGCRKSGKLGFARAAHEVLIHETTVQVLGRDKMRKKQRKAARGEVSSEAPWEAELSPSASAWWDRDWFFGLILLLALVLVYQPVWSAGFIWDDDAHVTRLDLRSWGGLERIWFELGATQQYYPFVHSIFWLEHGLWSDWPLGYHLANVFLHAISALLLLKILRRLSVPGAWLAAAPLRPTPSAGGIGRVDHRTQKHPFRSFLF